MNADHLYNSIRANPGCTEAQYRQFTKLREKEFKTALAELLEEDRIEFVKLTKTWRVKKS